MGDYDKLRGLVGQGMGGPKLKSIEVPSYHNPGSYTFVAPATAYYKFVLWGGGGTAAQLINSSTGGGAGGSGGYCEITRLLTGGQTVAVSVASVQTNSSFPGNPSTLTFSDGTVVTAGGGQQASNQTGGAGGTATGGDVNINGSAGGGTNGTTGVSGTNGGGTNGGAGRAASGAMGGGGGAPANLPYKGADAGPINSITQVQPGSGSSGWSSLQSQPGCGLVLVQCVKPVF